MNYREIMEPCQEDNFINSDATLKDALTAMQGSRSDALIVVDNKGISGILTRDGLLEAYGVSAPIYDGVKHFVKSSYKIANKNDEVTEGIFEEVPILIIEDDNGRAVGIVSSANLPRQLLKLSVTKMKKEIATKKLLHQEDFGIKQETSLGSTDFYIDYYNRLTKLVHINKELWDIIEYSSDSIYVTDGKGMTVYVNDAFEKMTGAPVSAVLGKTVFEAEEEGIYRPSISAIVLKERRQVTLIQTGSNGKDLIVTGTPVFDVDGNIYMVICNSKDIDELSILKNYLLDIKSASIKTLDESSKRVNVMYTSDSMVNVMKLANKVSQVDSTVMLTGESGTGKGLIARYIHENSSRAAGKMVEINCSAIPESLLESELFGYETGAFTGAQKGGKAGIIEMANKGTLFLDEIGDMPMHMQVKLLKVQKRTGRGIVERTRD
ncbi:MAG TPA: sigma 54-interacting transcriptional regulator [Bacillota bacterium]|nr:sigma 54-interacting transcriptional regulator [Bacillota bacterium]